MKEKGQAILEFAFVMVVLIFLIYGIVQVAHWTLITTAEESIKTSTLSGTAHTLSTTGDSMEILTKPLDMMLQEKGK